MKKRLLALGAALALQFLALPGFSALADPADDAQPGTHESAPKGEALQNGDTAREEPPAYFTYKNAIGSHRGDSSSFDRLFSSAE